MKILCFFGLHRRTMTNNRIRCTRCGRFLKK